MIISDSLKKPSFINKNSSWVNTLFDDILKYHDLRAKGILLSSISINKKIMLMRTLYEMIWNVFRF